MGEAILTRYRVKNADAINERIRLAAEEEARKRAIAEAMAPENASEPSLLPKIIAGAVLVAVLGALAIMLL